MKKVITYGTYDLFHGGHLRLLQRAKKLGDYLIVGVTTDSYDESRGKLNVQQSLMERIENVKSTGLADKIIIEEYEGQKVNDILKYDVDIFAIGSDWVGKFDYLKEYCDVVYLERTKGISSTQLRIKNSGIIRMGIVGYGRIANRFIPESKFVSGVSVEGVFGRNLEKLKDFKNRHQ
ncbi:MAG TPA: adenylyltransferase/cytidyltransferase family protein, partial [Tissierellaceae bacterium]|nr:adenylyltransferase/cytidyltransferase family protein [Tissierellaceae bacterium]